MSQSISWIDQRSFRALLDRALEPAPLTAAFPPPPRSMREYEMLSRNEGAARQNVAAAAPSPDGAAAKLGADAGPNPGPNLGPNRAGDSAGPVATTASPDTRANESPQEPKRRTLRYRPANGRVEDRASSLLDWLERQFECNSCFVADEHGLAVAERKAKMEHLAVCATLITTLDDVRPMLQTDRDSIAIVLDEAQTLFCVVDDTDWGRLAVGVVTQSGLSSTQLTAITSALHATFSEEENHEFDA